LGKYPYTAGCQDYQCKKRIGGTITLTDVGVEFSNGEHFDHPSSGQNSGSVTSSTRRFLDAFAVNTFGYDIQLGRGNITNATWNYRDFTISGLPETVFHFGTFSDRDRFWADLTPAIQAWASKYPQFVFVKLEIEKRCIDGQHAGFVPCSESDRSEEPAIVAFKESAASVAIGSSGTVTLDGCRIGGYSLLCNLTVTIYGADRNIQMSTRTSRLVDSAGRQHQPSNLTLGGKHCSGNCGVDNTLSNGVPFAASLGFDDISEGTTEVQLLEVDVGLDKKFQFRGVPVGR
jgi:hypothetical protein